jgi:hypothetical protein
MRAWAQLPHPSPAAAARARGAEGARAARRSFVAFTVGRLDAGDQESPATRRSRD